jgi:hypothetical protein
LGSFDGRTTFAGSPSLTGVIFQNGFWAKLSFLIDLCVQFRLIDTVKNNILLLLCVLGIFDGRTTFAGSPSLTGVIFQNGFWANLSFLIELCV